MSPLIYIVILASALLLYALVRNKNVDREYIQCVEAGGLENVTSQDLKARSYYDRKPVMKAENGAVVNDSAKVRLVVKGRCMEARGIYEGDVIVAEKVSPNESNLRDVLKPNDIVWLHVDETDLDKIRVFDSWAGDELKTYYYKDGRVHESRLTHKTNQVRGIVRYKVSA